MDRIRKIIKKTDCRYLNFYEMEVCQRNGKTIPYYLASRSPEVDSLKAVTGKRDPDGVILYGVYGPEKDKLVLIKQFRYPLGDYVYEFPAGLVESGEDMLDAATREMYEETGLTFQPKRSSDWSRPYFTTVGMTDESCSTVFGYCTGEPTNCHQEAAEDIRIVLADREECRRILREENVAIMCAYMLMHFISHPGDPLEFLDHM